MNMQVHLAGENRVLLLYNHRLSSEDVISLQLGFDDNVSCFFRKSSRDNDVAGCLLLTSSKSLLPPGNVPYIAVPSNESVCDIGVQVGCREYRRAARLLSCMINLSWNEVQIIVPSYEDVEKGCRLVKKIDEKKVYENLKIPFGVFLRSNLKDEGVLPVCLDKNSIYLLNKSYPLVIAPRDMYIKHGLENVVYFSSVDSAADLVANILYSSKRSAR